MHMASFKVSRVGSFFFVCFEYINIITSDQFIQKHYEETLQYTRSLKNSQNRFAYISGGTVLNVI